MKTVFIGIAGGTGSGKSTFTQRLKDYFGDNLTVIYHDNYYRRRDDLSFDQRKLINYDHPDSLETSLLIDHIIQLKNGQDVEGPLYDFAQHNRSDKTVLIKPCKVIIVEGILVLHETLLSDLFDYKIYLDADADERILRRAARDIKMRGRELPDIIAQYLSTVKPMHNLFVEPTKSVADIIINSALNEAAFDIVKTKIESIISTKEN
ncbi:uridine kinase [Succinivibrio dextrinosolvens]|uniref:uridine kinase n=1 Tax=Succinivibrio dextrinosolvens TaxID=83771 RepID=UPI0008DFC5D3|nr:uridine kinase [Succinivibrio dextrinosolvens]SFS62681.1 uridine kinase [Succinivibrio dextrinosolvens]